MFFCFSFPTVDKLTNNRPDSRSYQNNLYFKQTTTDNLPTGQDHLHSRSETQCTPILCSSFLFWQSLVEHPALRTMTARPLKCAFSRTLTGIQWDTVQNGWLHQALQIHQEMQRIVLPRSRICKGKSTNTLKVHRNMTTIIAKDTRWSFGGPIQMVDLAQRLTKWRTAKSGTQDQLIIAKITHVVLPSQKSSVRVEIKTANSLNLGTCTTALLEKRNLLCNFVMGRPTKRKTPSKVFCSSSTLSLRTRRCLWFAAWLL